jgi:hypothetical protein
MSLWKPVEAKTDVRIIDTGNSEFDLIAAGTDRRLQSARPFRDGDGLR